MFAAIHCTMRGKRTNIWSYALLPQQPTNQHFDETSTNMRLVRVDYVCSNPLHDENETHALRKSSRLYVCTAIHCMMRMKRTNAWSYALTWVDVGLWSGALFFENETHERMFLAWATSTRPRHTTKEEALRCIVSLVDWTNGLETYFYCILRVTVRKSSQARSVKVSEQLGGAPQLALCRQLVAAIHCMRRMKRTNACSYTHWHG